MLNSGRNNSYQRTTTSNVEKKPSLFPPEMVANVRKAVATGEYASSSEVVRDALRDWTHKRELQQYDLAELHRLWQQAGEDKSEGIPADGVLDELERNYQGLADAAGVSA